MQNNHNECSPMHGDIFYADLSGNQGSEQGGIRPVLIVQNNVGNKYSPTTIALAITGSMYKSEMPTHVIVYPYETGLYKTSVVLTEQIRTVDKKRLKHKVGHMTKEQMKKIVKAMMISCYLEEENSIEKTDPKTTEIQQSIAV